MTIRILGICGSPIADGNTEALLIATLSYLDNERGVNKDIITLADKNIRGCKHCNWCIRNQTEMKFCVQEDDMGDLYPKILQADGLLVATPVHFGRLSGILATMLDRLRVFAYGNIHAGRLRNKIGGALAVSFIRGAGVETALMSINSMFFLFDMIMATSRSYQLGAAAHSSLEGKCQVTKGIRHMVLEDEFGLSSARLLADRMLELARIVKAGKEKGDP
jgi:multimeric flavodoxin WrbA